MTLALALPGSSLDAARPVVPLCRGRAAYRHLKTMLHFGKIGRGTHVNVHVKAISFTHHGLMLAYRLQPLIVLCLTITKALVLCMHVTCCCACCEANVHCRHIGFSTFYMGYVLYACLITGTISALCNLP